jgi:hypothetical protein
LGFVKKENNPIALLPIATQKRIAAEKLSIENVGNSRV